MDDGNPGMGLLVALGELFLGGTQHLFKQAHVPAVCVGGGRVSLSGATHLGIQALACLSHQTQGW